MIKFFKRKKSNDITPRHDPGSFYDHLVGTRNYDLSFSLLIEYYETCSPVADAIDRICKAFSNLQPYLFDKHTNEFVDTPIFEVLDNPNLYMTRHQFLFNIAATYLITGNLFLTATGLTKLQGLNYVESQYLTLHKDHRGFANKVYVSKSYQTNTYTFNDKTEFYISGNNITRATLAQAYNPKGLQDTSNFGTSKLAAISKEIEQYRLVADHNISLLGKGAKVSGILSTSSLSDDQYERMKSQVNNYFSGAANAGRVMVLENGLNFSNATMSNTDMDYKTMRSAVEMSIYKRLEIPTALINESSMTYSNLEVANLMLFDSAVLPLADTLYQHLQDLIFSFYKLDSSRYKVTYDVNEIPALRFRNTQIIKEKASTGAYTYNEIRQMFGDNKLMEGGDDVYITSTQVPAGGDYADDTTDTTDTTDK